jgi:hypothetical protein
MADLLYGEPLAGEDRRALLTGEGSKSDQSPVGATEFMSVT